MWNNTERGLILENFIYISFTRMNKYTVIHNSVENFFYLTKTGRVVSSLQKNKSIFFRHAFIFVLIMAVYMNTSYKSFDNESH